MEKAIVVYVPVIHSGYLKLLERHKNTHVFVVSEILVKELDPVLAQKLPRQLNAITSTDAVFCFRQIAIYAESVNLLTYIDELEEYDEIVMPVSDVSKLIEPRISDKKIIWDTRFLQWDQGSANAKREIIANGEITMDEVAISFINKAQEFATKSSDFWRRVGAVLTRDNKFLLGTYNQHMPDEETPYVFGDPSWTRNAGANLEICGAIHGENNVIAMAARDGISTKGCDIYVTTYPCPICARTIAVAGIARVFFRDGYSTLDSQEILKNYGVKTIRVVSE